MFFEPETFANETHQAKRKADPQSWTRTLAKKARTNGSEFMDKNGVLIVKSKRIRQIDCLCGCTDSISDEDKEFIFEKFYGKGSHELQNEYLRGCTDVAGVELLANELKRRIFIHKLYFHSRTVPVCQKFFLAVHGIGRSCLRRKDYKLAFTDLFRVSVAGGLDLNSIREMRFLANCPPIANVSDRFDLVLREITFLADNIDGGQITEHLTRAKIMYDDFLPVNLAKVIFFDVVFAYDEDGYRCYVKGL
ncbi:unnamed protein product [Allacma fusca]|uniref:Uncharacterized protein n=1 Tax=Allacma fusca TaxID=39272 RepID=A0A8J2JHF7_9HEXA|nr:unnamed protein product [Allacma fusca]